MRHKFYWFDSDGGAYYPDFCGIDVEECPHQVDSVCDGIAMKKSRGVSEMSDYDYGTKFWRSNFLCDDDSCEEEEDDNELDVLLLDIAGELTKCPISAAMPPTKTPFKYLNFCDEFESGKRSDEICAPKQLCGPFSHTASTPRDTPPPIPIPS